MIKVSVVTLNWNTPGITIECLESLANVTKRNVDLEVIIIDNASNDDSASKFKKWIKSRKASKNITWKLIVNEDNLGFAAGNNVGISEAVKKGADYVLLLNNDTEVHKDFIVELLKSAERNKLAGVITPKIYFAKGYEFHKERYKKSELGKVIWAAGGEMDWDNVYGSNWGVDEADGKKFDKEKEVDFASGACMLLRVEALRDVGFFDHEYFMYLEDVDLCVRMKKQGWGVLYAPKSKIWHKVSQSSGIGSDLNDYFITRNRLLFGNKYASMRTRFALLRESMRFLISGRKWQAVGVRDYYLRKLGKGSWGDE